MTLDEKLKATKEQMAKKQHLEAVLPELWVQHGEITERMKLYEEKMQKGKKKVEGLECGSFAAFFYDILGKKEEKLEKERSEAHEAAVKYDVAVKELEAVKCRISESEAWLNQCGDCEAEYDALIEEKTKEIYNHGGAELAKIKTAEQALYEAEKQATELSEAIAEGEKAEKLAKAVQTELDSAEGWGVYDIVGGGLFADMLKYDRLDAAQKKIEELQVQLRSFKTELTDVRVETDIKIEIESFLKFTDYIFDNIFSDYAVMERIQNAKKQADDIVEKIMDVMSQLAELKWKNEELQLERRLELDKVITEARV